jgi:ornithine cyclodeaminase/alanine dehydrogenase-like protein (mu-crystallin family)
LRFETAVDSPRDRRSKVFRAKADFAMTLLLSNDDVEAVLTMPDCIAVMEDTYRELARGEALSRTRSDSFCATTRADALYSLKSMDGVAPKLGVGAVRINSDIITWPTQAGTERRVKVPAAQNARYVGLVLLFSSENGEPLAIFPDGVAQRMRVGAANGLGVKYLAREDAKTVAVLGSGWQAGAQLMALAAVRKVELIRCFSPNPRNREAFAREWSAKLQCNVVAAESAETAIEDADIVMCATNSIENVFFRHWLRPGMHVSSIKRPELEVAAMKACDLMVIHNNVGSPTHLFTKGVSIPEKAENKGWMLAEEIGFDSLPTLPQLVTGEIRGRTQADQITCFLNNLGLGLQFAAVGAVAYAKAKERGLGRELPTEWFTETLHP